MFIHVETPGVKTVAFREYSGWVVRYNRLFDVSPDRAPSVVVLGGNISIWALCFSEDLFQAENEGAGLILDVGWYPEADPEGCYKMRVIEFDADDRKNPDAYNWQAPMFTLRTRALAEVVTKMEQFMGSNPGA